MLLRARSSVTPGFNLATTCRKCLSGFRSAAVNEAGSQYIVLRSGKKKSRGMIPNRHRLSIHQDGPPNERCVASIASLPQRVAQHHHLALGGVFLRRKLPAHRRLYAQYVEEIWRDASPDHLLRRLIAGQRRVSISQRRHIRENLVLLPPIHIICRRRRIVRKANEGCVFPYNNQTVRLSIRQRPQQHALYRAEDSGVSPNT